MSSQTATSHSGRSGRGRTAESSGGPADATPTSLGGVETGHPDLDGTVHRVLPLGLVGEELRSVEVGELADDPLDVRPAAQHGVAVGGHPQRARPDVQQHVLRPAPDVPRAGGDEGGADEGDLALAERRRDRAVAGDDLGRLGLELGGQLVGEAVGLPAGCSPAWRRTACSAIGSTP